LGRRGGTLGRTLVFFRGNRDLRRHKERGERGSTQRYTFKLSEWHEGFPLTWAGGSHPEQGDGIGRLVTGTTCDLQKFGWRTPDAIFLLDLPPDPFS